MSDRLYYFLLGFMMMGLIAVISVAHNPEPETTQACGKCGANAWWFRVIEDDNQLAIEE